MSSFLSRTRKTRERAHRDVPKALFGGRIPHPSQLQYLSEYLSRTERVLLRVATLFMVVGLGMGIWQFWSVHLENRPAHGGTYSEGLVGAPKTINPLYLQANDVDHDLASLVYSSLFSVDENQQIVPDVATTYELSEDKKTYTVHLREDVYFHDGEQLNADDVLFTLDAIQDSSYVSPLRATFSGIATERVDDFTVSLTLKEPFAPFPSSLTFGIVPEHLWITILPEQAGLAELNLKPIGSGPYAFDSLKKDQSGSVLSMSFAMHEQYHGGQPYIEEMQFKFYPDLETSIIAVEEGNVEGISYVPKNRKEELADANGRVRFHSFRLPQYTAVFFNMEADIFQNDEVREALGRSVHKQNIIDAALGGEGSSINTPILPGQLGYDADITGQVYDLGEARRILDEAGWAIETNEESENVGLRVKDDQVLRFTIRTVNLPEIEAVATTLQSTWESLGIDVNIDAFSSRDVQNAVINDRDYEALLFGVILGTDPDPYPFWHSSQVEHPGLNLSVYKDKTVDALLEEARETDDTTVRTENYHEFQEIVANELPALFLYNPVYTYVHDKKLQGIETTFITRPSDRFRDVTAWYINTSKGFPSSEEE